MLIGTGSRSTAEVPVHDLQEGSWGEKRSSWTGHSKEPKIPKIALQVGWLDVAAMLEAGGGCGADLAVPFAGLAACGVHVCA